MLISLVINKSNSHARRVKSAVSLINACQHYFSLKLKEVDEFSKSQQRIDPLLVASQIEAMNPDGYSILVLEDQFQDDWFSHEYRSCSIISIGDWEANFAPPSLRAYVIYEVAMALINFSADLSEEMSLDMVHEPSVGCIYDLCLNKSDIKLGMVAGNVCPNCIGRLRAYGTDEQAIDSVIRITSLVRAEALGNPITLDPEAAFIVMRFTKNDENDNAWLYGIKPGVEACGLRPLRADDNAEAGHLLEKIGQHIRRSRLVIVKVDEDNLNVFFELGLAMGLDKDVLLISESSLVLNVPSDLKGWECLTYERGNYKLLADNVEKFLRVQYHI